MRLLKPWESPRKKRKKSSASFIAIGQNNRTQAATFGCVAIQGFLRKVFPIAIKPHTSRQGGFVLLSCSHKKHLQFRRDVCYIYYRNYR
nr:MAG TPA_asm: hypothetical protein [Caudoviricetes sp.]DAO58455.1 MAG TPA: hypothetical protein [Caudoviricetes sp.]DAV15753.1 MAG TPA: hypothetical protein [Caudoviricetes sp.]